MSVALFTKSRRQRSGSVGPTVSAVLHTPSPLPPYPPYSFRTSSMLKKCQRRRPRPPNLLLDPSSSPGGACSQGPFAFTPLLSLTAASSLPLQLYTRRRGSSRQSTLSSTHPPVAPLFGSSSVHPGTGKLPHGHFKGRGRQVEAGRVDRGAFGRYSWWCMCRSRGQHGCVGVRGAARHKGGAFWLVCGRCLARTAVTVIPGVTGCASGWHGGSSCKRL